MITELASFTGAAEQWHIVGQRSTTRRRLSEVLSLIIDLDYYCSTPDLLALERNIYVWHLLYVTIPSFN